MTGREAVTRAIEFSTPDRLPVDGADTRTVRWNQVIPLVYPDIHEMIYDEWGCGWSRTEKKNMGQVKDHPLEEWSSLKHFKWPDPDNSALYEGMEQKLENPEGKYIKTAIFLLLSERLSALRGFQNALTDLYLEREKIAALADRVLEFDIAIIRNIASRFPGRIDGFQFSDDWGTQQDLIIDPALWREFYMPRYRKLFRVCKEAGWHVWMHSCGKINKILQNLIDIGLDVINPMQPRVLGIEETGRDFAGKICFCSLCDIQKTLPGGSEEEMDREAGLLIKHWGTDRGGFILGGYGDEEAIGMPIQNRAMMREAFLRYDRWRKN